MARKCSSLGQDIGPVKVENAVGFGPAVAEILELDAQFIVQLTKQALLEHQDLFLGGLGRGIGAFQGRTDAPHAGFALSPAFSASALASRTSPRVRPGRRKGRVRPREMPQAFVRVLGREKPAKKSGMAIEPGQLHGGRGSILAQRGHAQGWPRGTRVFPDHHGIDGQRGEGHCGQKLNGFAAWPRQQFVQLQCRLAPLLFLLDDLVAQAGFLGPGAENIGVSGRTGAVFRLQVGQKKVEPPERLFQGMDGVPGKDSLPIGALHLGRHDEPDPGELGLGQVFAQAADLHPERTLSRELEDLLDAQTEFRFSPILPGARKGHPFDAGRELGLGPGPELQRPPPGGIDLDTGGKDFRISRTGRSRRLFPPSAHRPARRLRGAGKRPPGAHRPRRPCGVRKTSLAYSTLL